MVLQVEYSLMVVLAVMLVHLVVLVMLEVAVLLAVARVLAAALQSPTRMDLQRLRRVVRYMVWTVEYVLLFHYQAPPRTLDVYADSDWAGDSRTRKSCSSGVLLRRGGGEHRGAGERSGRFSPGRGETEEEERSAQVASEAEAGVEEEGDANPPQPGKEGSSPEEAEG